MSDDEEFYTVYETAQRQGVTPPTVYNWIKAGLRSSIRHDRGRKVCQVIADEDVVEFLHKSIADAAKQHQ